MSWQQRIECMWWSPSQPPVVLRGAGYVYGFFSRLHLRWRERHAHEVAVPVVSVGNITVGGSGKTPFVIWLAGELCRHGYKPVVLCRGDGGTRREVRLVGADSDPFVMGDEACVLARLTHCPVVAAQDRVAGAEQAATLGDVIVLDDGFQYRRLHRDCDIVMVPAAGVGNGCLIPAGPLREPLSALVRADLVVRSGSEVPSPLLPELRQWHWRAEASGLEDIMQVQQIWKGGEACALTGIARPQRFLGDLQGMGVAVAETCLFPDHHRYTVADIQPALDSGLPVVTTMKDAVKLAVIWPKGMPLWVLMQRYQSDAGLADAVISRIRR